jgi:hypothetical protein
LYGIGRPNGLSFSGRLEGITLIEREAVRAQLNAKIAPIQPLRCNDLFGGSAGYALRLRKRLFFSTAVYRIICVLLFYRVSSGGTTRFLTPSIDIQAPIALSQRIRGRAGYRAWLSDGEKRIRGSTALTEVLQN